MKAKSFLKRLIACSLISVSALQLTACSSTLTNWVTADLGAQIKSRFDSNIEIVNKLYAQGLITEESKNRIVKNIETQIDAYLSDDGYTDADGENHAGWVCTIEVDDSGNITKCPIANSIKSLRVLADGTVTLPGEDDDINTTIISNYLLNANSPTGRDVICKSLKDQTDVEDGWTIAKNSEVQAIKAIDPSSLELTDIINAKIYVLKDSITTADGTSGIDGVVNLLQTGDLVGADGNIESISELDNYFTQATFSQNVTASDGTTVLHSKGDTVTIGDLIGIGEDESDFSNMLVHKSKTRKTETLNSKKASSINEPGYDLVVEQLGYNVMTIKWEEFDYNVVEQLYHALGIDSTQGSTTKWIRYMKDGENRMYLMEYPAYYINELRQNEDDNSYTDLLLDKSSIGVNLYTGNMVVYYDGDITPHMVTDENPYLTLMGAQNQTYDTQSAFILAGSDELMLTSEMGLKDGYSVFINTGRIVLRDYLEATYAPGFTDEDLVCFGRKIRWNITPNNLYTDSAGANIFKVKNSEPCATFVDLEGKQVSSDSTLYITDFCDTIDIMASEPQVTRLPNQGEAVGLEIQALDPSSKSTSSLKTVTAEDIDITRRFPGDTIGVCDYYTSNDGNTQFEIFYAQSTVADLFSTGLYSGWVNSQADGASVKWWNDWLSTNGYKYHIDLNSLEEYLYSNFAYELSQNGIIILDLNVVSKLNDHYKELDRQDSNAFIRTGFKVIGWFLMVYASLLIVAWIMDTNVDIGYKFLEKITFGNLEAVKYSEDIPQTNESSVRYVDLKGILITAVVMVTVGSILILTDIFAVALMLIKAFGRLAMWVTEVITGA